MKNLITLLLTITLLVSCKKDKTDNSGLLLIGLISSSSSSSDTGLFRINLTNAQALGVGKNSVSSSSRATDTTGLSNNLYSVDNSGVISSAVSSGNGTFKVKKVIPGKSNIYLVLESTKIAKSETVSCVLAKADSEGKVTCVDFDLKSLFVFQNQNTIQTKNSDSVQVDTNDGVYYYGYGKDNKLNLFYASSSGTISSISLPSDSNYVRYFFVTTGNEILLSYSNSSGTQYLSVLSGSTKTDIATLSSNTWVHQRSSGKYLINPGLPSDSTNDALKEYDPATKAVTTKIQASGISNYDTYNTTNFAGRLQDIRKVLEINGVTYFYSTHEACHVGHLRRQLGNLYKFTSDTTLNWLPIGADSSNQTIKNIEYIEAVGGSKVLVWGHTTVTTNGTEGDTITQTKSDSNLALILFDVDSKSSTTLATYTSDKVKLSKIEYSSSLNTAFLTATDTTSGKAITGKVELASNKVTFDRTVELSQIAPIK